MQSIVTLASFFSAACFLYYGLRLIFSQDMSVEFERYGLSQYRRLTGALQLAGSLGLSAGAFLPLLPTLAALGLATLMALGIRARAKVGDSIAQMVPALVLLIVNSFIFIARVQKI